MSDFKGCLGSVFSAQTNFKDFQHFFVGKDFSSGLPRYVYVPTIQYHKLGHWGFKILLQGTHWVNNLFKWDACLQIK